MVSCPGHNFFGLYTIYTTRVEGEISQSSAECIRLSPIHHCAGDVTDEVGIAERHVREAVEHHRCGLCCAQGYAANA